MNIGSMGMIGSVAGTPLSQTKGSDSDRSVQESSDQARQTQAAESAERAAGIGETEQDEQASDRDADGRRIWEQDAPPEDEQEQVEQEAEETLPVDPVQSKDPTGNSGSRLDLTG